MMMMIMVIIIVIINSIITVIVVILLLLVTIVRRELRGLVMFMVFVVGLAPGSIRKRRTSRCSLPGDPKTYRFMASTL